MRASSDPPSPRAPVPFLVSRRGVAATAGATVLAGVVFLALPSLDLEVARLFYGGDGTFIGHGPWNDGLRRILSWAPFVLLGCLVALHAARRFGRAVAWAPTTRGLVFLVLSAVAAPGIMANVVLKDHSHRPRPIQTQDFGGSLPYRPFGTFDGGCRRNCSFVSGEGSAAVWTVAPALLVPASVQPLALAAAVVLGVGTSLLRMSFGGHYLSDVVFAALFTLLVVAACWRVVFGRVSSPSATEN